LDCWGILTDAGVMLAAINLCACCWLCYQMWVVRFKDENQHGILALVLHLRAQMLKDAKHGPAPHWLMLSDCITSSVRAQHTLENRCLPLQFCLGSLCRVPSQVREESCPARRWLETSQ